MQNAPIAADGEAAVRDLDEIDDSLLSICRDTDATDGRLLHLGSDLPSVPAESGEAQTSDAPSNQAPTPRSARRQNPRVSNDTMGANNSREEINAAVDATAAALNGRSAAAKSDGKLKRPSISGGKHKRPSTGGGIAKDPSPVSNPFPKQRIMSKPSRVARPDPFDIDASPDNRLRREIKHLPVEVISPLKKDKKARKQVPSSLAGEKLRDTRAKDQQMIDAQLLAGTAAPEPHPDVRRSPRRPGREAEVQEQEEPDVPDGVELGTQDAREKVWFPEPMSSATRRSVLSVQLPAALEEDDGSAENEETAEDVEEPEEPADAAVAQEDVAGPNPPKPKRGRPKKSETTKQGSLEKSGTAGSSTRRSVHDGKHDAVEISETVTKKGAAKPPQKPKKQSSTRAQRSINAARAAEEEHEDTIALAEPASDVSVSRRENRAHTTSGDDSDEEDDYHAENEFEDEDESADEDSGDGEAIGSEQRRQPVSRQLATIAPSEISAVATGDALQTPSPKKGPRKPQKRKADDDDGDAIATANTSKKRRTTAQQEAKETSEPPIAEPAGNSNRFYGQWHTLRKVFKAVNDIGVNYVDGERKSPRWIKLADVEVKGIVKSCNKAIKQALDRDETATTLAAISDDVDALYQAHGEHTPDFENELRIKNIYSHLFPKLLELLRTMITTFESTDNEDLTEDAYTAVTMRHLETVNNIISLILDLGEGVKEYISPHSSLALVRPVRQKILAPLKTVYAALRKVVRLHNQNEEYKVQQQQEAEERALATQREEQEERRATHARRVADKWHKLHEERMWAEGGIISAEKRRHLRLPDPPPEFDQNGVRFERLEVFAPRTGPPPAMVEAAREHVWTMSELDALAEGLQKYKGPYVFEKVFRRFCPRYGLLNKYNVTEIVTVAAGLKEYMANVQQEQNGEVEDWVKAIPVWTKGHPLGKENTEAEAEDAGVESV